MVPWAAALPAAEESSVRQACQQSEPFDASWKQIREKLATPGTLVELGSRVEWTVKELEAIEALVPLGDDRDRVIQSLAEARRAGQGVDAVEPEGALRAARRSRRATRQRDGLQVSL